MDYVKPQIVQHMVRFYQCRESEDRTKYMLDNTDKAKPNKLLLNYNSNIAKVKFLWVMT